MGADDLHVYDVGEDFPLVDVRVERANMRAHVFLQRVDAGQGAQLVVYEHMYKERGSPSSFFHDMVKSIFNDKDQSYVGLVACLPC